MQKSKRSRCLYQAIALAISVFLVGAWVCKGAERASANIHSSPFKVVIDAGHGGIDGGVSGKATNVKESDLNLQIARALKQRFESAGIEVVMTRNSYGGLYGTTAPGFKMRDLQKRVKIINSSSADVMISVHLNCYSSPKRRGATVFFASDKKEGERLAVSVQKHLNLLSGQTRELKALKGDYYLLNEAVCPSVICECGFLSNEQDEELLLKEEYQREIADRIFYGVVEYLMT